MDVCEWLDNIKKLDQLIDAKVAERDRLISIATDISPRMPDGMPISHTGMVSQKMQNAVCALVDLEREIDKLIAKYISEKQAVLNALEKLPEKEYGVLHRYYLRRMTMEAIAEDMGYADVRQIYRIKKNGFAKLRCVVECHAKSEI